MTAMDQAMTRPWNGWDYAMLATSIVAGVAVGAGATRWALMRRAAGQTALEANPAELGRRADLLRRLADHLGNRDLDPEVRPAQEILLELQHTLGLETADGEWSRSTEKAIRELLRSGKKAGTGWRPKRRMNPGSFQDELEPEDDWEVAYEQRFAAALQACRSDPTVVSFDQCLISLLERIFPESGSFMAGPGTGAWKKAARERARSDLGQALGPTEMHARATLTRDVGIRARQDGSDVGQAVRKMAQHAWPNADWDKPERTPWQATFSRIASAVIQG